MPRAEILSDGMPLETGSQQRFVRVFRQFLVVLSRTNGVSVTQNNYGTVFRIHGAQLGVQLIQSLLTLWLQSCFVEVEQHVRLQSETLGFNNWSRSWSWSNWSNYVILTEAVRNARAQHGVVWTCANGTCVTDVAYELVVGRVAQFWSVRIQHQQQPAEKRRCRGRSDADQCGRS